MRATSYPIPAGVGGHGGGESMLLTDVFCGSRDDPLGRRAGYADGLSAVAVGIARNRSMATKQAVDIADLDRGIAL